MRHTRLVELVPILPVAIGPAILSSGIGLPLLTMTLVSLIFGQVLGGVEAGWPGAAVFMVSLAALIGR